MDTVHILIAVDCQVDFCTGSLGTKEAQASIPSIVEDINAYGEKDAILIATMDTHGDNYLYTSEGKHLPVPHTIRNTEGWAIAPEIVNALSRFNVTFLKKDRFGSPELPGLVRILTFNKTQDIIGRGEHLRITLVGWCTDICVISNALLLKAEFPEAEIIVHSRSCAGVTPEKHEAALEVMRSCQIRVV